MPRFCGGAVGYAAYDAIRYVERLPNPPPDALGLPDLFFAFYDLMVVFDHLQKTVLVICSARLEKEDPRRAYEKAVARIDEAVDRLRTPVMKLSDDITPRGEITLPFRSNFAPATATEAGRPSSAARWRSARSTSSPAIFSRWC